MPTDLQRLEIPGFSMGAPLGAGGMADVIASVRESDGQLAAIKVPRDPSRKRLDAFRQEVAMTTAARHDGIVRILDWRHEGDSPWLAMERLRGLTLAEAEASASFTLGERLQILIQLAHTLSYVHSKGILHLDIKPRNIFVADDLGTKLFDFGVSRWIHGQAKSDVVSGSPGYMSPEHVGGLVLNEGADVFSLGVLAYWLMSGRTPWANGRKRENSGFDFADPPPVRTFIAERFQLDPADLCVQVFHRTIHRAIVLDREERLASPADFAHALETLRAEDITSEFRPRSVARAHQCSLSQRFLHSVSSSSCIIEALNSTSYERPPPTPQNDAAQTAVHR